MYGWTFAARTIEEVGAVLCAMGKHRYLAEVDLRLHWAIDAALVEKDGRFAAAAARFVEQRKAQPDLDLTSRDPGLWRAADVDEVITVLDAFWNPEGRRQDLGARLRSILGAAGIGRPDHRPFEADTDEPPHPELVLLDWVLLPVDELDTARHAGALRAMADSGEEVDPSQPGYLEGPTLSEVELCEGCPRGVLPADFLVWADGAYLYCEYLCRGVGRAAKLVEPPVGYRDVDKD